MQASFAIRTTVCTLVLFLGLSACVSIAHAQSSGATLELSPANPGPNETVAVSLSAYTLNTSGATIRWYQDGAEIPDSTDARNVAIPTAGLGESTTVRAAIGLQNGTTVSATRTIVPTELDLIVEANTKTPLFYAGRALPIGDEPAAVTAVLHTGSNYNSDTLVYTWRLGSRVLLSGPTRGADRITFTMPKYNEVLSLTIQTSSGVTLANSAIRLTPATPELHFYEENALRGLSARAVGNSLTLVGEETTVRAEPYFVATDIFSQNPAFKWELDGNTVANYGADPQTLTLRGSGGSGDAQVKFSLTNRDALLQTVRDAFTVYFAN